MKRSSVYGPVHSWRFGNSLGIDPIVETSTCSFNCIYCQLGAIQRITTERRIFVPISQVREDLNGVAWDKVDVITFSGSGEPTLATNLGEIVEVLRSVGKKPIHLLTNSTLLHLPEVRQQVRECDVIACKLDAISDEGLRRVNRPAPGVRFEDIVAGILALKAEYRGRLTLQVMCMPVNIKEVRELADLIRQIGPAEVQLNTPRRPYPLEWYLESRGDHQSRHAEVEKRTLKVITPEQAAEVERELRERTGVPFISVYERG